MNNIPAHTHSAYPPIEAKEDYINEQGHDCIRIVCPECQNLLTARHNGYKKFESVIAQYLEPYMTQPGRTVAELAGAVFNIASHVKETDFLKTAEFYEKLMQPKSDL